MYNDEVCEPLEFREEIDVIRMEADKAAAVKADIGIESSNVEQRLVSFNSINFAGNLGAFFFAQTDTF